MPALSRAGGRLTEAFVKNSQYVYFGNAFLQVVGLVVAIAVIRRLPVEVYGTYVFLVSACLFLDVFCVSPMGNSIVRFVPELEEAGAYGQLRRFLLVSMGVVIVSLVVALGLIAVLAVPFGSLFNIVDFTAYRVPFLLYACLISLKSALIRVATSLLLHKYSVATDVGSSILQPVLIVAYLPTLDVTRLLYIHSCTAAIGVVVLTMVVIRHVRSGVEARESVLDTLLTRGRIVRYTWMSFLNGLGSRLVNKSTDYFVVAAVGSPHLVGLYGFADRISQYIRRIIPVKQLSNVIRPVFFRKFSQDVDLEEYNRVFNLMVKVLSMVYLLPLVYFLIFGQPVIRWVFDPRYLEAYAVVCIILSSFLFSAFFYPVGLTVLLSERLGVSLQSKLIVLLSIPASIVAMKYWSIEGVAVVTVVGSVLASLYVYLRIRKSMQLSIRLRCYSSMALSTLVLGLVFVFLRRFVVGLSSLMGVSMLFALAAAVTFVWFNPFDAKDVTMLKRLTEASSLLRRLAVVVHGIHARKPRVVHASTSA